MLYFSCPITILNRHRRSAVSTDLTRPRPPFPYDLLPPLPAFTLESEDIAEGERIADRFTAPGENISPELHWSGLTYRESIRPERFSIGKNSTG